MKKPLSFSQRIVAFTVFMAFLFGIVFIGYRTYTATFIDYPLEDIGIESEGVPE